MRWLAVAALGALAVGGCQQPGAEGGGGPGGDPTPIDGDAGVCARPETGCACDPGEGPVDCYLEPVDVDGVLTCNQGTRYCRGGTWTACESLRTYTIGGSAPGSSSAALIDGPSECNPCNPDCSVARDYPTSTDLTPGNSTGVEYDPGAGGIIIGGGMLVTDTLDDTDGDGVPDVADECPGTGWRAPCDGSATDDGFYHTLPYGGPIEVDPLDFTTRVTTADVYFLMDTTGSMGDEIANLQSGLTSGTFDTSCPSGPGGGIIGAIKCIIPDAQFGVGRFDDYPIDTDFYRDYWTGSLYCVSPYRCYGSSYYGDVPYAHLLDITSSVSAAQAAVNSMTLHWGGDGPESHTQALWSIATGGGLGPYLGAHSCSGGRWGYPCFRPDTIPIVIMFSDAPMHNGPSGYNYYSGAFPAGLPKTWSQTVTALTSNEIRMITIESCDGQSWCAQADDDDRALENVTGSVDALGNPYWFPIGYDGSGLDTTVVDAVWALANNTRFDVSARAVDNPSTGIDERGFVDSIVALSWGPGTCSGVSGSTFIACTPGTVTNFRVNFRNDFVMPTTVPQVFDFTIEVLLDGTVQNTIPVRIVVPPEVMTYPATGSYWRDYDATTRCAIPPQRPDWGTFSWDASAPPDSSITFLFRTADTVTGLDTASPASVTVPPTASPIDVGSLLVAAGETNFKPYLRVTAVLLASSDRTVSPVLTGFEIRFTCMSSE